MLIVQITIIIIIIIIININQHLIVVQYKTNIYIYENYFGATVYRQLLFAVVQKKHIHHMFSTHMC